MKTKVSVGTAVVIILVVVVIVAALGYFIAFRKGSATSPDDTKAGLEQRMQKSFSGEGPMGPPDPDAQQPVAAPDGQGEPAEMGGGGG